MANIYEPTPEKERVYQEWLASRPAHVREVAARFRPWILYKMGDHRVLVYSFGEKLDGSVNLTVNVSAQYNFVTFERSVFGVDPNELTECDLPGPEEPVGALFTQEEVHENIDVIRAMMGVCPKEKES